MSHRWFARVLDQSSLMSFLKRDSRVATLVVGLAFSVNFTRPAPAQVSAPSAVDAAPPEGLHNAADELPGPVDGDGERGAQDPPTEAGDAGTTEPKGEAPPPDDGDEAIPDGAPRAATGGVSHEPDTENVPIVNVSDDDGDAGDASDSGTSTEATKPGVPSSTEDTRVAVPRVVTVSGRVIDQLTSLPVANATVFVFGSDLETRSDAAGKFQIEVPAGLLSLAVVHEEYPTEAIIDIQVSQKGVSGLQVRLSHAAEVDDLVLFGKPIEGGAASVLAARRKASSVQDAIGSEDIAKSPDGSAGAATRRIVGASIVGGQYLFVRGLGGRYSNTRLNGIPLPSTDPDLPGFQLDLFPTAMLSSLTIAKTFTPDIPGDFAGGSLNVETRSFPEEFLLKLNTGVSGDTLTTGRTLRVHEGGKTDFLGYDDGTRDAPNELPAERVLPQTRANPDEGFAPEQIAAFGRGFQNRWAFTQAPGVPNLTLGASLGDTFRTRAGKFGYFLTAGYRSKFRRALEDVNSYYYDQAKQEVVQQDDFRRETARYEAQIGSLGTLSYAPIDGHEVSFVALLTQNADDQTRYLEGFSESDGGQLAHRQYQFVERQLQFGQLLGKHRGLFDEHLDIGWQFNAAKIRRHQPDTRIFATFLSPGTSEYATKDALGSGEHLFTKLDETSYGAGLDAKVRLFADAVAKAGYMGRTGDRQFGARRYKTRYRPGNDRLPPEELFAPANSGEKWDLQELTVPTDGFDATQTLHAGYLMTELPVTGWLRLVGGVRHERFRQQIAVAPPYAMTASELESTELQTADRTDVDWLPAASVVAGLTEEMNVRVAYGGTVARPQLRELAPFASQDLIRRRLIQGNPELERTFIHNFDVRWELFPSGTEVFAVSAFYKSFEAPIESVIISNMGNLTFENIRLATSYGAEIEARWSLGSLSRMLADFSAVANLALIASRIELYDEQARIATSKSRAMAGQSPFIVNASVGYEPQGAPFSAFLYYNVFGRRVRDAGRNGMPDIYEEPVHQLDLGLFFKPDAHWVFSLSASNLLHQYTERYTQGGKNYSRLDPATLVSVNAAWTL